MASTSARLRDPQSSTLGGIERRGVGYLKGEGEEGGWKETPRRELARRGRVGFEGDAAVHMRGGEGGDGVDRAPEQGAPGAEEGAAASEARISGNGSGGRSEGKAEEEASDDNGRRSE
ncbi:hypothetical protein Scep_027969 [Stephania cephalantha]|uniref:Uncharacterized protein n=1 Tax=Stephania cephalantha TaxID=152367 RepID=A0AAP0HLB6_9MAGN